MAIKIGVLEIDLRSNTAQFVQGMDKGLAKVGQFKKSFASLTTLLIGGTGVAGFTAAVKGSIDFANTLGDLNTRLGLSTEFLSQMKFAAESNGVQFNTLVTSIQRFTRRTAEAADGSGVLVDVLKELGLDAQELTNLKPEDAFLLWADALSEVENKGKRASFAMAGMDTEGVALTQVLDGGSKSMRELADEADRLGLTISQNTATQATDLNFKLGQLKATSVGWIRTITGEMLPTLNRMADAFVGSSGGMESARKVGVALDGALKALLVSGTAVTSVFDSVGRTMGAVAAAANLAVRGELGAARNVFTELTSDVRGNVTDLLEQIDSITGRMAPIQNTFLAPATANAPRAPRAPGATKPDKEARQQASEAQRALNALMAEGMRITEATRAPAEQLQATMTRLNELAGAGAITQDTFNRAKDEAVNAWKEETAAMREQENEFAEIVDRQLKKTEDAQREIARSQEATQRALFGTLERSLSGLLDGTQTVRQAFTGMLTDLGSQLARLAAQKGFAALFGGGAAQTAGAGGGGGLGSFFGNLLGFQHGGSFTVGGTGGTDSQPVAFRATPGETVSVDRPGGGGAGNGGVTVIMNASFMGGAGDRSTLDQLALQAGSSIEEAMRRHR